MADQRDAHVVEIPVDHEDLSNSTLSAIQNHPLMEISQSPGHLLLLKLWQREEALFAQRIANKETRSDEIRREISQLCYFFFVFHGLFSTLLYTSSLHLQEAGTCRNWWVPSFLSLSTSIVIIFFVQMKIFRYWKVSNQLQRERSDGRALTRCIQELRMKGAGFDLSKEPQSSKRMKSSSVQINWKPLQWCSRNLVTILLLCFTDKLAIDQEPTLKEMKPKNRRIMGAGGPEEDNMWLPWLPHLSKLDSSFNANSTWIRNTCFDISSG